MTFYELDKQERVKLVEQMRNELQHEFNSSSDDTIFHYAADVDTYIRKNCYLAIGKLYNQNKLRGQILSVITKMLKHKNEKVRQTGINAAGEIGITDFESIETIMDQGLFDQHHSVRNAVIGSIKKMGQKNPVPVLKFARKYLNHPDKEIRREICHGIELRGRTHPGDILPLLRELQFDKTARVRNTLVHVIGQIAYKKDCLLTVLKDLKTWKNKDLVKDALEEIIDVHDRYKNFSYLTTDDAETMVNKHFKKV